MKSYIIRLRVEVEAESEEEALKSFRELNHDGWYDGEESIDEEED